MGRNLNSLFRVRFFSSSRPRIKALPVSVSRGSTGTRAYSLLFFFFHHSPAHSDVSLEKKKIDRDKEECAAKARRIQPESKRRCNLLVSILLGKYAAARKFCSLRKVNLEKESLSPSLFICALVSLFACTSSAPIPTVIAFYLLDGCCTLVTDSTFPAHF